MGELEELHERHGDEVAFFIVYIREAHPEDGWVLADNRREEIAIDDPTTLDERAGAAAARSSSVIGSWIAMFSPRLDSSTHPFSGCASLMYTTRNATRSPKRWWSASSAPTWARNGGQV